MTIIDKLRAAAAAQEKAGVAGSWIINNWDFICAARSLPLSAIADVIEAADELADEVAEYRNCKLDNGDMPSGVLRAADALRAALATLELGEC